MDSPHLLTFPTTPADLHQLGQLDCQWDLVTRSRTALTEPWVTARAIPASVRPVTWSSAITGIERRAYDAVVCHRLQDLSELRSISSSIPAILRADPGLEAMWGLTGRDAATRLGADGPRSACVFQSEGRRGQWLGSVAGDVIRPGLDVEAYGPYVGDLASVVVMGHLQIELPLRSGYDALERIAAGLPLDLVGFNPSLNLDRLRASRHAWLDAHRRHRVYLNTSISPFGDAANLAVLEAMASGAPVVSLADPESPVEHGVTGFVAEDPASLRLHLLELLEDRDLAARLGEAARRRIARDYGVPRFHRQWSALLRSLTDSASNLTQISA